MRTAIRYVLSLGAAFVFCVLGFVVLIRIAGSLGPVSEAILERLSSLLSSKGSEAGSTPATRLISYGATPSDAALAFALSRSEQGILVRSVSVNHAIEPDLAAELALLCTKDPRCTGSLEIDPSTIEDFNARQKQTDQISDPQRPGITIAATSEFERVARERAGQHVNTDLPFLVYVSPVGFSSDRQQALIFLAEYCGSLCGGSWYLVLENRQGVWLLTHALLDSVS